MLLHAIQYAAQHGSGDAPRVANGAPRSARSSQGDSANQCRDRRECPYEILAAVSSLTEGDLRASIEHLTASGLLIARGTPPDAIYAFKHALVQDAAYGTLLITSRQQLHARIGEILERVFLIRRYANPNSWRVISPRPSSRNVQLPTGSRPVVTQPNVPPIWRR